ncbi:MAG: DUF2577 domain-containing protein [Anaerotignum sp.]|nr:DUF2577 domain-containing protein [Anaerotignum sp.]
MLEIIKQLAVDAMDTGADFCIGTVVAAEPLRIRLEQGLELTESFLILTEAVSEWEETGTIRIWTDREGDKWSSYRMKRGRKLQAGEAVALIKAAGGQQYLVLCRVRKEG